MSQAGAARAAAGGHVLAIDQGTTSTRALVYDADGAVRGSGQRAFAQIYPRPGWVEHDPEAIWASVVETGRAAIAAAGIPPGDLAGIGITNQRESVIVWDRESGRPIHNAIVWQDRRTAEACARLAAAGHEPEVTARTGLVIDPYFSATKIAWLLDNVDGARAAAEAGRLAFGTVDTWLVWRLTGGERFVTDATNAARTLLYDIRRGTWDEDLLRLFAVPRAMLPEIADCIADFGTSAAGIFGAPVPIRGMAGDQQAAAIGQACIRPGMVKATYGTGCFALVHTGAEPVASRHRLLTTLAWQFGGRRAYALEGSIFVAGAAVQWLRDEMGLIAHAAESGPLAARSDETQDVVFVPAFVGLGAPYWDPDARGALYGLTRGPGPAELARAALEAVCFQTLDLIEAMRADCPAALASGAALRVDGGMSASDWTMQRLADLIAAPVERPADTETTARGAAWLAAHGAGLWPDLETFAASRTADARFAPALAPPAREAKIALWRDAVSRTLRR